MLYIIEGLDGTGKTTLAAELSHVLKAPVLKTGAEDAHNDYIDDLIVARAIGVCQPQGDVILDRSIFSGLSYGQVGPIRSFAILCEWLEALRGVSLSIVHLIAPEDVRRARDLVGTKGTLDITLDLDIPVLLKQVAQAGLAQEHTINYGVFDTGRMQPGHILAAIFEPTLNVNG